MERPGAVLFEVEGTDAASAASALEVRTALRRKMVLGLVAEVGIPTRPEGPAVALRVRMSANEAQVVVNGSDATAKNWVGLGKFTLPVMQDGGKLDVGRFADALAEGTLNRLVRVQLSKGVKDRNKMHYQLRDRQCIALGPQWLRGSGDDQQTGRDAQGPVGHLAIAAAEHECFGE